MVARRRIQAEGNLPLFGTKSEWIAPSLSDLPSWKAAKELAIDSEFWDPHLREMGCGARRETTKVAGISFMIRGHRPFYVPWGHPDGNVENPDKAKQYFRDNARLFKGSLLGANITGDLDVLDCREDIKFDFNEVTVYDVQILDALVYELHRSYSLESIGKRRNIPGKDKDLLKKYIQDHGYPVLKKGWERYIAKMPARGVGPYAEHDVLCLFPIFDSLWSDITEQGLQEVVRIECQMLPILLEIRQRGIRIDFDQLDRVEQWSIKEELATLEKIRQLTGHDIGFNNCNAAAAVAPALLAVGIQLPKTESTEQWSITSEILNNIEHPAAELVKYLRQVNKIRRTYVTSIRKYQTNGRIHGTLRQIVGASEKNEKSGAAYGRLSHCVAAGTPVEVVRDVAKHPKGINIEDVRAGDLVYTYDNNLKLALRKVTWAGHTGKKKVVRLHWRGYGGKHSGHVDLTADHLVRRTDGTYVEAAKLQIKEHVLALSRGLGSYGYARLWPTGAPEIAREHRFIYQQVNGDLPEHVHHINENKLDNRPENLEGMSHVEHTAHHAQEQSPEIRAKQGASLKARWATDYDRLKALIIKSGEDSPTWLGLSYEYVRNALDQSDWSVVQASRATGHDFQSFKGYVIRHGFDLEQLKQLNKDRRKQKGIHPYGQKKVNNHQIVRIEELPGEVDVYDLTVEDTHNFIAGEICVHNCHPNTGAQPSRGKHAAMWRDIYLPEEGQMLLSSDFSAQEPRWAVSFSSLLGLTGAEKLAEQYRTNPRIDPHGALAELVYGPGFTKDDRTRSKTVYLARSYNQGGAKLCRKELKLPTRWKLSWKIGYSSQIAYFDTRAEAVAFRKTIQHKCTITEVAGVEGQAIADRFDAGAPFLKELNKAVTEKVEKTGFLRILGGRVLHFPLNEKGEYDFTYKALNRLIQGTSGYQTKLAMIALFNNCKEFAMHLQIHDELVGSIWEIGVAKKVGEIMRDIVKAKVPFRCEAEIGKSLGSMAVVCNIDGCTNMADKKDKFGCHLHKLVA